MREEIQWLMEQPMKSFNIFGLRLMVEVAGTNPDELPPGIDKLVHDLYDRMSNSAPTMRERVEALACDLDDFKNDQPERFRPQIVRCVETMHDTARVLPA